MNQVNLVGKAGKDPESRETKTGSAVTNFSLATNEGYYGSDDKWIDRTEWHSVVAFARVAERITSQVRKGDTVAVFGKISTRKWEDKDGNKRQSTEIICNDFVVQAKVEKDAPGDSY